MKALLREPLVHFLLLGALLFAVDAWLRPSSSSAPAEIVVSEARVRALAQNFARTWQRPPTREELDGLIEGFVREEVMLREALALGLDRDDAIVRKRMQQKVEFIAEGAIDAVPPTDAELAAYLQQHPERFRALPSYTFAQVYLDPTRRGAALQAGAATLRVRLARTRSAAEAAALGDRLLLLEPAYDGVPHDEVAKLFGDAFAQALAQQPVGEWVGPLASGYGVHLVRVDRRDGGGVPSLDAVRPLVEREFTNARRKQAMQEFYDKLRAKYTVTVQWPQASGP
jgi:hypothetical protein